MTLCADSLMVLLDDARAHRPPVYDADAFANWTQAIAQCILALPTAERQWAATVLVAGDLVQAMPGTPMAMAYGVVQQVVEQAERGVR